ncbi:MAG: DUF4388 domain-containing protein [Acidobacteriota bacterium]
MKSEGDFSTIGSLDLLLELWNRRFSGAVRMESDAIIKIIYLRDGDLISASTNDRTDSIGEILLKAGKLTREHLTEAMRKRKENESTGETLLALGFTSRSELSWARRTQLVGVIRSTLGWSEGSYSVVKESDLPKPQNGSSYSFPQVMIEVFLTFPDRSIVERYTTGTLIKTSRFDETYSSLQLNEDADQVAGLIDGRRDASQIATASSSERDHVIRLLAALVALGLLDRDVDGTAEPAQPAIEPVPGVPGDGVTDSILNKEIQAEHGSTALESGVVVAPKSKVVPFLLIALVAVLVVAGVVVWRLGTQNEVPPMESAGNASTDSAVTVDGEVPRDPTGAPVTIRELAPSPSETATDTSSAILGLRVPPPTATETPVPATPLPTPTSSPAAIAPTPGATRAVTTSTPVANPGGEKYTVRFAIYCRTDSVDRARTIGGDQVWFRPVVFRGEQCQRAFYGHYDSATEAAAALNALPESLREGGRPAVVTVGKE